MKYTLEDKLTVIQSSKAGRSLRLIQQQTGFGPHFIRTWYGRKSVERKAGSGRPTKLTAAVVKKVKKAMFGQRRRSLRKVSSKLKSEGVDIGHVSVRTAAKKAGLKPYHRTRKPGLTDVQKERRLMFAKKYRKYDWKQVIFSDETTIALHTLPNRQIDVIWAESADQVPPVETHKYSSYIKFWGGIGYNGSTKLVVTKKPFNSLEYQRVLKEGLQGINKKYPHGWVLQQDGDRAHTSAETAKWMSNRKPSITVLQGWPANSPDLSIIENVWPLLKDSIAGREPKSTEQLIKFAKEEWSKLKPDFFKTLINSVPNRLSLVLKAKGGPIHY
jgi:transposase